MSATNYGQNLLDLLPERPKEWRRVITADANIDVSVSSLILEPNDIFRAKFRTSLSKSEEAFEKPGVKYKTRLETVQFDSRNQMYRVVETVLLDSSDKTVFSSGPVMTARWREIGRTAGRMYSAASELRPLGSWTIASVRYADGGQPSSEEAPDLTKLIGSNVSARMEQFQVARETCRYPAYESQTIDDKTFEKAVGVPFKTAGLVTESLDALLIRCRSNDNVAELHLLFLLPADKAVLFSGGVLLDLEKPKY